MRIVFAARNDLLYRKGGDTTQILETKRALETFLGLDVRLCLNPEELRVHCPVDIVHVFNLQTAAATTGFIHHAQEINAKVVLSTIYWNLWNAACVDVIRSRLPTCYLGFTPALERSWRFVFHGRGYKAGFLGRDYVQTLRDIIAKTDLFLPNSPQELEAVCRDAILPSDALSGRSLVVPNAADISQWGSLAPESDGKRAVAMIGRIEPIKNQLGTIYALKDDRSVPLLIIGRRSCESKHREYCDAVMSEAEKRGNVEFFGEVSQEEVRGLLERVKVHALPSFRESPGLATLEALAAGCNIVTSSSKYCPIEYYSFDKYGSQCNPFSTTSIRASIMKELSAPAPRVCDSFFNRLSYEYVAKQTFRGYSRLMNAGNTPDVEVVPDSPFPGLVGG